MWLSKTDGGLHELNAELPQNLLAVLQIGNAFSLSEKSQDIHEKEMLTAVICNKRERKGRAPMKALKATFVPLAILAVLLGGYLLGSPTLHHYLASYAPQQPAIHQWLAWMPPVSGGGHGT